MAKPGPERTSIIPADALRDFILREAEVVVLIPSIRDILDEFRLPNGKMMSTPVIYRDYGSMAGLTESVGLSSREEKRLADIPEHDIPSQVMDRIFERIGGASLFQAILERSGPTEIAGYIEQARLFADVEAAEEH